MSGFAKQMGLSVLVVGLVIGAITLYETRARADRLANGEAQVESLFPASAGGRALWVSLETQYFSNEDTDETVWRASVYELETGKRVARRAEVPWHACAQAGEGRLWCHLGENRVELVSLPGLETLHSADAIQAKVGQKMMDASQLRVTGAGALRTMLADGRAIALQPDTLELAPAAPEVPEKESREDRTSPFFGLRACSLPNSGRSGLCIGFDDRRDSGEGFLRPRLLEVPELKDRLLVLAKTSLDETVSALDLWVLDEKLERVTHRVLTPKEPTLERLHWLPKTRTIVLGFRAPANATIAIDIDTSAERYRIKH